MLSEALTGSARRCGVQGRHHHAGRIQRAGSSARLSRKIWQHLHRAVGAEPRPTDPAGPKSFAAWMRTDRTRRPADMGGTPPRARTVRQGRPSGFAAASPSRNSFTVRRGLAKTALVEHFWRNWLQPACWSSADAVSRANRCPTTPLTGRWTGWPITSHGARTAGSTAAAHGHCRSVPHVPGVRRDSPLPAVVAGIEKRRDRAGVAAAGRCRAPRNARPHGTFRIGAGGLFPRRPAARCDQDSADVRRTHAIAAGAACSRAHRRDDVAASRFLPGMLKVDQPVQQRRAFAEQAEIALEGLSTGGGRPVGGKSRPGRRPRKSPANRAECRSLSITCWSPVQPPGGASRRRNRSRWPSCWAGGSSSCRRSSSGSSRWWRSEDVPSPSRSP